MALRPGQQLQEHLRIRPEWADLQDDDPGAAQPRQHIASVRTERERADQSTFDHEPGRDLARQGKRSRGTAGRGEILLHCVREAIHVGQPHVCQDQIRMMFGN